MSGVRSRLSESIKQKVMRDILRLTLAKRAAQGAYFIGETEGGFRLSNAHIGVDILITDCDTVLAAERELSAAEEALKPDYA